jgi:hypothetical protein|tara:strand:+ start:1229 stop:1546 length:318 start_codon:yes stop_codon:yes gene_type:complete
MAAISMVSDTYPNHKKATLSGTINTQQEFTIPGSASRVEVQFVGAAGVVVFNGGTDAAVISSEVAYPIPQDSAMFWDLQKSKRQHTIHLASGTGSTVVHCIVYGD